MVSNNALIGHTGFIGQALYKQLKFTDFYNSKNIDNIKFKEFDLVVSCGNSSSRWLVNQDPEKDYANILLFIENIKTIKANMFVLISTIDVYQPPSNVNEDVPGSRDNANRYGRNRYLLEEQVKTLFPNYLIVRLPIMYGYGFKKNVIYDGLNKHELHKVNKTAKVQIYNVKRLGSDLNYFLKSNLRIVNLATEPLLVDDIYKDVFNITLNNNIKTNFEYDMQTKHLPGRKYFYTKEQILNDLKEFKHEYESIGK